jgi:small-conductance mechanosensitive channel
MEPLLQALASVDWIAWLRGIAILAIGLLVARLVSRGLARAVMGPMGSHTATTLRRFAFYVLTAIVLMAALREVGFGLGVLLGAAGVLTIAIGFASQTSASNLVSGLFLVAEKPFMLGDVIRVGQTTGEVLSIDLLSVKLRTFENLYVRIPNEMLIKTEITTMTRFPIRRIDLQVGIAYKENIGKVHELLLKVADEYELCLSQPKPIVIFQSFGDSSVNLQLSAWATRANFLELRNRLPERIKTAFDEAGIEIPFPHLTLFAGVSDVPLPVRLDGAAGPGQDG